MKLESRFELVKRFFYDNKVPARNFVENAINALFCSNPVAFAKFLEAVVKSPFFIREQMFWTKFAMFLDGIYLSDDDCAKLRDKLAENGNEQENAERLVTLIEKAETKKKVSYLINATRYLLTGFINLKEYFLICNVIVYTLQEDLQFLRENIHKDDLDYSYSVQCLLAAGIMHQSVIDIKENQISYSFTPLAELVDRYALSYEDVNRYQNPKNWSNEILPPKTEIKLPFAKDEEVNSMLDEYFPPMPH